MENLIDGGNESEVGYAKRLKESHIIQRVVEVDDNESELCVTTEFNGKNGNFKINTSITTTNVSMINPDVNAAVRNQLSRMLEQATELMIEKKRQWSEEPESNQIKLEF